MKRLVARVGHVRRPGVWIAVSLFGLAGCLPSGQRATAPLRTFSYAPGQGASDTCAVLLPGRGGHPDNYRQAGLIDALVTAGFDGEIVGVDAHLAYYLNRTVIERLHEDVMAPRFGKKIWLAGVSMGGLGALLYEKNHPGEVEGLVLLAPYLGDDDVIAEIEAAGGLRAWNPGPIAADDFQRELWLWIKEGGLDGVRVHLGWGTGDGFAEADALLAETLGQTSAVAVPGGHVWPTWRRVWDGLLAMGAFGLKAP